MITLFESDSFVPTDSVSLSCWLGPSLPSFLLFSAKSESPLPLVTSFQAVCNILLYAPLGFTTFWR